MPYPLDKFVHPADGKGCIDKLEAKSDCLAPGHGPPLGNLFVGVEDKLAGTIRPGSAGSKCDAAKLKCAGKEMAALLGCYAKAETAGSVDAHCVTKAGAALENCYGKADAYGDRTGAVATADVEIRVANAVDRLRGGPTKRCAATAAGCTGDEDCPATNLTGVCLSNAPRVITATMHRSTRRRPSAPVTSGGLARPS